MRKSTIKNLLSVSMLVCCAFIVASLYIIQGIADKTLINYMSDITQQQRPLQTQQTTHDVVSLDGKVISRNLSKYDIADTKKSTFEQINSQKFQTSSSSQIKDYTVLPINGRKEITSHNKLDDSEHLTINYLVGSAEMTHLTNKQNCSTRNKNSNLFNDILGHDDLVSIFKKKIAAIFPKRESVRRPTCESHFKIANSCDNDTCLQTQLPDDITARIAQLVTPCNLQLHLTEREVLRQMADEVVGNYDVTLLTAASSNHFRESQALLKNLHENVYPYLENFTLIFYNLGLTEDQKILTINYCRCQVIDFPFHRFPNFMKTLKCYAWKPVLIKSLLQKTNVVFWMDASVRFHNSSMNLQRIIRKAKNRGIQVSVNADEMSFRVARSMFHFFGDEPCAYLHFGQVQATYGVYHREYFVDRVILEPWVACALNEDCICPGINTPISCKFSKLMSVKYYHGKGPIIYGMCHRFDQSALGLILHKLYQDLYPWITVITDSVLRVDRGDTINYFPGNTDKA